MKFISPPADGGLLDPVSAVCILRNRGYSLEKISRLLGKPQNYAVRILHGKISAPNYKTVDILRSLVAKEAGETEAPKQGQKKGNPRLGVNLKTQQTPPKRSTK